MTWIESGAAIVLAAVASWWARHQAPPDRTTTDAHEGDWPPDQMAP